MRALLLLLLAITPIPSLAAQGRGATIATHYFYWYRWPDRHFDQPGAPGPEGHARHLPEPEKVSYESVDWHEANFAAMAEVGIDVALPVYWGAPGAYDLPALVFSRAGLPPMVAALDAQKSSGSSVKLGMFYDTTTLRNAVRNVAPLDANADLTTDAGRALFCATVVEYFEQIPERHWALHRGGPLVVLYTASHAAKWDATLGDSLRTAFAARFPGKRPCLVADASWGEIGQDLTTLWGAALAGPKLFPGVAQIGPGYDDSPVPGRRTALRDREDGAFYAWSWQQVLRHRPGLVLLETWNEMHEGTELCETIEAGTHYLQLTSQWVAKFRRGVPAGADIRLRYPDPRPRPDLTWGADGAGLEVGVIDFGADPIVRSGVRERLWEDGPGEVRAGALHTPAATAGRGTFLYFQLSDHFAFDVEADYQVEVALAGKVDGRLEVQYDACAPVAPQRGAYRVAVPQGRRRERGLAVYRFALPQARFSNRQNGESDLRLSIPGGVAAVVRVTVRRTGR